MWQAEKQNEQIDGKSYTNNISVIEHDNSLQVKAYSFQIETKQKRKNYYQSDALVCC